MRIPAILARTLALSSAVAMLLTSAPGHADVNVDWLYDFRHATDPRENASNFPVVELKVFFPQSFGSFLMKEELDLNGANHNVSRVYTELSQSIQLGSPQLLDRPLFAHLGYSGGLGLFGNGAGGYYITDRQVCRVGSRVGALVQDRQKPLGRHVCSHDS